jgi:ATP-dependent DNA helicase PIF1
MMRRDELTIEQEYALQQFEEGNNMLLTGPGGTGKSCLIRKMIEISDKKHENVQVCAMTGCAALLVGCGATTLHSWSGIKMARGLTCEIITNIRNNKKTTAKWRSLKTLILDEVSMLSKRLFELLDAIGKDIRGNKDKPFGGIQLIFTGDFYQLPPIGGTEEGSGQFCFESDLWYKTFPRDNHIELTTLFRQRDPLYKNILNNIREGKIDIADMSVLRGRLNIPYNKDDHNGVVPTKLFATKASVDRMNQQEFDKLTTQSYEYNCIQKADCIGNIDSGKPFSSDFIAKCRKELNATKKEMEFRFLTENCPMEKLLCLKEGSNVMCTVNLDLEAGICNGSVGVIIGFSSGGVPLPTVKFSNGITKLMSVKYWQSEEFPTLAIGQIPLKLAWAMTIHKSQGATLTMGEVDIGSSVFECGQTYVALSRIQSLEGLYLCGLNPSRIKVNPKVRDFYSKIPKIEYDEEEENISETVVASLDEFRYITI